MSSIDDKINEIKGYIVSMRYNKGMAIVDVKLRSGWVIPKSKVVGAVAYDKSPDTYMFYSEDENILIDDIIEYVKHVVKINIDREAKENLLKAKLIELREYFKMHDLSELETLKFVVMSEYDKMPTENTPSMEEDNETEDVVEVED